MEAPSGIEPLNKGFADPSLSHLGTAPRPPYSTIARAQREGNPADSEANSTLRRLSLFAECSALFHLADIIRRERHFAGRVAHIHGDFPDLLGGLHGSCGQRFHVRSYRNKESVHGVADTIRLLVDRGFHSVDQVLQGRYVELGILL